jgi:hypothetical protein
LVEEIEVLAGCDGMRVARHREVASAIAETLTLMLITQERLKRGNPGGRIVFAGDYASVIDNDRNLTTVAANNR